MLDDVNGRSFTDARSGPTRTGRQHPGTRQAILDAGRDLFLTQGYHGTSMRQVARGAGISPAAIYNHFPSKEDLFVSLLRQALPQRLMVEALEGARGETPEELVHDGLRRMGASMAGGFDSLRLMFVELLEFQGRHAPPLAEELLPGFMVFFQRLLAFDGRIRPYPPIIVGRAFLGLFMSYAITVAFFSGVATLQLDPDDLQVLGDIFLHGVLTPGEDE
jgi:AcrR family transcriptional regulator